MQANGSLIELGVIGGLAVIVVLANYAETRPFLRAPVHGILAVIDFIFMINFALPPAQSTLARANSTAASIAALAFGIVALLLLFGNVRRRIAPLFPRRQLDLQTGLQVGFDPDSTLHMTALVLCVFLLANTVLSFIVEGGLSGLAQNFTGITGSELWTQLGIWLLFAALGVGLGLRRSLLSTLRRLGLRAPTLSELFMGAGMAAFLFGIAFFVAIVWEGSTSKETFNQQTVFSEKIGNSVNTLLLGFLIAGTAAVGEEIAFRGALQPIFGLWPTAIFFGAIHTQYVLTPASLLIVIVGLGLGWLRRKYNTTTSIVAHFLYDFVPLAIFLFGQLATQALTR